MEMALAPLVNFPSATQCFGLPSPCSPMDKALASEAKDCGFESHQGYFPPFWKRTGKHAIARNGPDTNDNLRICWVVLRISKAPVA